LKFKSNIKIITFILTVLLFSACGKEGENKSYTRFKIVQSAIQSGIPQNGGILVLGHRLDDAQSFMIGLPDPNFEKILELDKGPWEFYAIGWEGDTSLGGNIQMTGVNRCGYVAVDMTQNDQDVVFDLNKANCSIPIPGENDLVHDPNYFENFDPNLFRRIQVRSCLNIPTTLTSTSCTVGSGEEGLTKSYRVEYPGVFEKFNQFFSTESSLTSKCINVPSQNILRLPVGSADGGFIEPLLFAYQDVNCQGPPIVYHFHDGFFTGNTEPNKNTKVDPFVNSNYTALFIQHNPQTASVGEFFGPYGFGIDGDQTWSSTPPSSITGSPGMTFEEARVIGIDPSNTNFITLDSGEGANFADFDEIIWYVNEEDSNGCGPDYSAGLFHFNRIKTVSTGVTDRIELIDPITQYRFQDGSIDNLSKPPNSNLSITIPATGFCSIQILRVRNFNNLHLQGTTIMPNTYDRFNGVGGVLAMKVFNTLSLSGAASVIDTSSTGIDGTYTVPKSCPTNKHCVFMGDGGFSASERGGGVSLIFARNVDIFQNLNMKSNGDPSGGNPGASAGHLSLHTQALTIGSGSTLLMESHGGAGTGGDGVEGIVDLKYCGGESALNGTKSLSSQDGGGNPFPAKVIETTNFCF